MKTLFLPIHEEAVLNQLDPTYLTTNLEEEISKINNVNNVNINDDKYTSTSSDIMNQCNDQLSSNSATTPTALEDPIHYVNNSEKDIMVDPDYIPDQYKFNSLSENEYDQSTLEIPDMNRIEINCQNNNHDVPHNPLTTNNEEEIIIDGENRKRKKNNSSARKKPLNKIRRMTGEQYLGYRRTRDGRVFHDTQRDQKVDNSIENSKMQV